VIAPTSTGGKPEFWFALGFAPLELLLGFGLLGPALLALFGGLERCEGRPLPRPPVDRVPADFFDRVLGPMFSKIYSSFTVVAVEVDVSDSISDSPSESVSA
jgi:hypothetical protein